jgi:hypothetical protein
LPIVTAQDTYIVSLHRTELQTFTAAVTNSIRRSRSESGDYMSRRDALSAAQIGVTTNQ